MSKIYTKTGDKGETSLVDGKRVSKSDPIIEIYGTVDELNSSIGVIVSFLESSDLKSDLAKIQNFLFDLGSNLACSTNKREVFNLPKISKEHVTFLEKLIDDYDKDLDPLKEFILPGGAHAASFAHVARSLCRRLERVMIDHSTADPGAIDKVYLKFINRLSDYLFVLSRKINFGEGVVSPTWKKSEPTIS